VTGDSDSDKRSDDGDQSLTFQSKLRFEYITETRLQIDNNSFSAIQKVAQGKALKAVPCSLNILNIGASDEFEEEKFFIYTNILDQVLVFSRVLTDVTPSTIDMAKVISSGIKSAAKPTSRKTEGLKQLPASEKRQDEKNTSLTGDEAFALPDSYKEKIMKQAKDMGYQDDSVASDNENMVTDLLAEDSDDVMKRIQEECDQEAQRDEKLL